MPKETTPTPITEIIYNGEKFPIYPPTFSALEAVQLERIIKGLELRIMTFQSLRYSSLIDPKDLESYRS